MKKILAELILFVTIIYSGLSCKKEDVCTACLAYEKNLPPVANAGPDFTIKYDMQNCSYELAKLDGSASTDPDGRINLYSWKIISPYLQYLESFDPVLIFNHSGKGEYLIELRVHDLQGKFDSDTFKVTVENDYLTNLTDVNINLSSVTEIPTTYRDFKIIGGSETKLLFNSNNEYDVISKGIIAMLDIKSLQWKEINLSQPRAGFSTLITGEKIFIAGGGYRIENSWSYTSEKTVDIYDITSGLITISNLTDARTGSGTEYFGTKAYFIGGTQDGANDFSRQLINIEVYDTLTKKWSIIPISAECSNYYVRAENKLYFLDSALVSTKRKIIIFDMETNIWSESESNIPVFRETGVADLNNIYWLGNHQDSLYSRGNDALAIFNTYNKTTTFTCIPEPSYQYSIFSKNNKVFIRNQYQDIDVLNNTVGYVFNPASGQWNKGKLSGTLSFNGIYQFGKEIFAVASNRIYRVDF